MATSLFLSSVGVVSGSALGGGIGVFTGCYSAWRSIVRDPEQMERIKKRFRDFEKIVRDVEKIERNFKRLQREFGKIERDPEAMGRIEKAFRNDKKREKLAKWWEERVE